MKRNKKTVPKETIGTVGFRFWFLEPLTVGARSGDRSEEAAAALQEGPREPNTP